MSRYQYHERVENGDLNIVVPGKFVAFSGPAATRQEIDHGVYTWAPENYTNIFRQLNVTTVVRLNKKSYDRRQFTDNGFKHVEMYAKTVFLSRRIVTLSLQVLH